MIDIGNYNTLRVFEETQFGFYLIDDEDDEQVLIPNSHVPDGMAVDQEIEVFVYNDGEDRPIATTKRPKATVGQIAKLKVVDNTDIGSFVDFGLQEKHLLIPFQEQTHDLEVGKSYLIYLYLDTITERMVGTTKLSRYLEPATDLKPQQEVDIMIWNKTDLGYKAIINKVHEGLIFNSEVFKALYPGDQLKGYISKIREDGKITLSLQKFGYSKVEPNAEKILNLMKLNDGFLALNDKSDPALIQAQLNMSKKLFKKSIGALYKQRIISITEKGIELLVKEES